MVQSDSVGSTRTPLRLPRQQARVVATILLALVHNPISAVGLRHQSAWLGGGRSCSGSSAEAVLCKRDAWLSPIPTGGVPEVIHQAWFPATKPLPPKYADWQQTWVTNHPGWQLWLWSDVTNRLLVSRHFPWLLKFYDGLPHEIMRCDFVRPMYMHRYGGMYVDLDTESLKPMQPLLEGHHVLLAAIGRDSTHEHSINNGFMASRPAEDFWMFYLQGIVVLFTDKSALDVAVKAGGNRADGLTGPVMLRRALREYRELKQVLEGGQPDLIKVLEPKYLFPNSWMEGLEPKCDLREAAFDAEACKALFPEAYALTYFAHTWE